jgi:hypothetical protein
MMSDGFLSKPCFRLNDKLSEDDARTSVVRNCAGSHAYANDADAGAGSDTTEWQWYELAEFIPHRSNAES